MFHIVMGGLATFNGKFAASCAARGPVAWVWNGMLGEEQTATAIRRVVGPLAIAFGCVFWIS